MCADTVDIVESVPFSDKIKIIVSNVIPNIIYVEDIDTENCVVKFKSYRSSLSWFHKRKSETITFAELAFLAKDFCFKRANIELTSKRLTCYYGNKMFGSTTEIDAILMAAFDIIYQLFKEKKL